MMVTDKNSESIANNNGDALERIVGIGPKTAEALAQIGVQRFADLAEATAEGLAKALFDQLGFRVSPKQIEARNWIGQAQALVQQLEVERRGADDTDANAGAGPEQQLMSHSPPPERWQQHACFFLFFDHTLDEEGNQNWQVRIWRTRAYRDETGQEEQFPGTAPEQWVNWILQHADLPEEARTDALETAVADVNFQSLQIEPQMGPALRVKKLTAKIRFTLTGASAQKLASANTRYQLLLPLVEVDSGETLLAAATRSYFQPGQVDYSHQLEFPIPNVGRYEVQCILLASPPVELVALQRGPIVRVTP